jgi:hypothetical protein
MAHCSGARASTIFASARRTRILRVSPTVRVIAACRIAEGRFVTKRRQRKQTAVNFSLATTKEPVRWRRLPNAALRICRCARAPIGGSALFPMDPALWTRPRIKPKSISDRSQDYQACENSKTDAPPRPLLR